MVTLPDASDRDVTATETAPETEPAPGRNAATLQRIPTFAETWRTTFLRTLRDTGNITRSAYKAGVTRDAVYGVMERDAAFKAAVHDAREGVCDGLEESLAVRGQRSDTPAAIAYLKAYRPAIWDRARQVDIRTSSYSEEVHRLEVAYTPEQLLAMYEAMRSVTATDTAKAPLATDAER